jgi:dCTP deaminase
MRLLVKQEIEAALNDPAGTALAYLLEGDPPQHLRHPNANVRSTSLELTIGEIFIPGSSPDDLGGIDNGKLEHNLTQGHTAVIRTRERLRMGAGRAAVAFPPAHVSLKGLLMTNPGHVDPGYEGPLHCTVINMGYETYSLNRGERIMRVLVFELDNADQVAPNLVPIGPASLITNELLARLSVDFVDVEKRAKSVAERALSNATYRATWISAVIPVGLGVLGLIMTLFVSPLQGIKDDIVKLRGDISTTATKVDEKQDIYALETKLATLKAEIAREGKLEERLNAVETRLNVLAPPARDRTQQ